MKNNGKELIKKFKSLETKLLDILKIEPIDVDENMSSSVTKKNISKYIKKVKEAKAVFDEYEMTAKEIEKIAEKDSEKNEWVSKAVVDFREDNSAVKESIAQGYGFENDVESLEDKSKSKNKTDEYENKNILVDGKVVSVKKKKVNNQKEL